MGISQPAEHTGITRRPWRWVLLIAAVIAHLVVLYIPTVPSTGGITVPGADKAVHVLIFGAVMLTGLRAGIRALPLAIGLAAHAVVSEVIQHLALENRAGDPGDVIANLAGIAVGWYLAGMISRHRTGAEQPPSASAR